MSRKQVHSIYALLSYSFLFSTSIWASGGSGKSGSIMDVHPGLTIWTIITFLVLLTILRAFAWKPLLEGLDKREKAIRDALDESEKAREESKKMLAEAQKQMEEAERKSREALENAKNELEREREARLAKIEQECAQMRAHTESQILRAKEKAIEEMYSQMIIISTEIASKIIHKALNPNDHAELISTSIAEIRSKMEASRVS